MKDTSHLKSEGIASSQRGTNIYIWTTFSPSSSSISHSPTPFHQISTQLDLPSYNERLWEIQACSALKGLGLQQAFVSVSKLIKKSWEEEEEKMDDMKEN